MIMFGVDWTLALSALKTGHIVYRMDSVWKNQEMRLTDDQFQSRYYVEGILEHCEPHWSEWKETERHTYPANINAKDWVIQEEQ